MPILFKTLVYFTVVLVVRLVEEVVEYWVGGGSLSGTFSHVREHFAWHRFAAVQIWIFVLFLIYTTAAELDGLLGHGELRRMLFGRSAANPRLARHSRMRTSDEPRDRTGSAGAEQAGGAARAACRADLRTDLDARGRTTSRGAP